MEQHTHLILLFYSKRQVTERVTKKESRIRTQDSNRGLKDYAKGAETRSHLEIEGVLNDMGLHKPMECAIPTATRSTKERN
jgi:hypothetical protein